MGSGASKKTPPPNIHQQESHYQVVQAKRIEDQATKNEAQVTKVEDKMDTNEEDYAQHGAPSGSTANMLDELLQKLNAMDRYDTEEALEAIEELATMAEPDFEEQKQAADYLAQKGYAELTMKVLSFFKKSFKNLLDNEAAHMSHHLYCSGILNYTDASILLCKKLARAGTLKVFIDDIKNKNYLNKTNEFKVKHLLEHSLTIMFNMSKATLIKDYYVELKAVDALKPYLKCNVDLLKTLAVMTLANIIEDEDCAMLEDTGAIPFMVRCLGFALEDEDRQYDGWSPQELAQGLGRMAVNDKNKHKIIGAGALPHLVHMMQYEEDVEEQLAAANTVWNLSFKDDVKDSIKKKKVPTATLR